MVFTGRESAKSFLTLLDGGRRTEGESAEIPPSSFPQHFLTFSFNLFVTLFVTLF